MGGLLCCTLASPPIRVFWRMVRLCPVITHMGFMAIPNVEGGCPSKGLIWELLVGTSKGVEELPPVVLLVIQVRVQLLI